MRRVILISGKQGSCKTTLSNMLPATHRIKFADPLYEMHAAVYGVLFKYGIQPPAKINGALLQYLGTDFGRKSIGEFLWVDIAVSRVAEVTDGLVVIDDARFANEIASFPDALKVRLECPEDIRRARAEKWRDLTSHPSEVGLDDYQGWDLVFDTSNPANLEAICQKIMSTLKVAPTT